LLALIAVTLVVLGIAAVYSASSIRAVEMHHPGWYFALKQLVAAVLGGMLLVGAARIDYHVWQHERRAWFLLGATVVLLLILLLPFTHALAPETNGARRWLRIGPFGLQPSEFATLAAVIWTAMLASKKQKLLSNFRRGIVPFLVVLLPVAGLIILEPNLSSGALLLLLTGIVLFTAGARIGHFLLLAIVAIPIVWHQIVSVQYRVGRMVSFLSAGEDAADASWQITQSLVGMGAGQLLGRGIGEGTQKLGYLPQAFSDFIFSAIGEEWGFVGVVIILTFYTAYVAIGFHVARTARDRFGTLLATGLTAMIGLTAALHVAVTMALVPTTGLPLPFLSYGGSQLLVSLIATGILVNIAKSRGRA
jgi:cell division protein FtsW